MSLAARSTLAWCLLGFLAFVATGMSLGANLGTALMAASFCAWLIPPAAILLGFATAGVIQAFTRAR